MRLNSTRISLDNGKPAIAGGKHHDTHNILIRKLKIQPQKFYKSIFICPPFSLSPPIARAPSSLLALLPFLGLGVEERGKREHSKQASKILYLDGARGGTTTTTMARRDDDDDDAEIARRDDDDDGVEG